MKHPATRELFEYWNELRGLRSAPDRAAIDPAAIRGVLADTFMLDVDPGQTFPFRLTGTRVNGLFDADQKGLSFLSIWRLEERRNIAAILMTVLDGTCPVVMGGAASPNGTAQTCDFEILLLPLRHQGRSHSRILGLIVSTEKPAWLHMLPVGPLALQSLRILEERTAPIPPQRAAVGAATGAQREPLALAPGLLRRKAPALRLIRGGLA